MPIQSNQPESVRQRRKLVFLSKLPLRRHIARWGTFSVEPGILVSLYASAHHPYTTLATSEWMIFWPSEDSHVEVGPTECSRHLEIRSSLHVRLLPATLQSDVHVQACTSVMECSSSRISSGGDYSVVFFLALSVIPVTKCLSCCTCCRLRQWQVHKFVNQQIEVESMVSTSYTWD